MSIDNIRKIVHIMRGALDEIQMELTALEQVEVKRKTCETIATYCTCEHWDFSKRNCGKYKQTPPQNVIAEPNKFCPAYIECLIPF